MTGHGLSLTSISPYKDKIVDSSLYGRIQVRDKAYSGIFYAVTEKKILERGKCIDVWVFACLETSNVNSCEKGGLKKCL